MGTKLSLYNISNIMVADAVDPCVARTSAPMILNMQNRWFLVLWKDFNYMCHVNVDEWYSVYIHFICPLKNVSHEGLNVQISKLFWFLVSRKYPFEWPMKPALNFMEMLHSNFWNQNIPGKLDQSQCYSNYENGNKNTAVWFCGGINFVGL